MKNALRGRSLARFQNNLLAWFRRHRRELPWRASRDPYRVWVAEIMLQQTRIAAVIPYYERFLSRFPTVEALADAPAPEVLRSWAGLGYYSRARNLHAAAKKLRGARRLISAHARAGAGAAGNRQLYGGGGAEHRV